MSHQHPPLLARTFESRGGNQSAAIETFEEQQLQSRHRDDDDLAPVLMLHVPSEFKGQAYQPRIELYHIHLAIITRNTATSHIKKKMRNIIAESICLAQLISVYSIGNTP